MDSVMNGGYINVIPVNILKSLMELDSSSEPITTDHVIDLIKRYEKQYWVHAWDVEIWLKDKED